MLIGLFWSQISYAKASPCNLTLKGQVRAKATAEPLGFVRVDVTPSSTSTTAQPSSVGTNMEGAFTVQGLCEGTVQVSAQSPGFKRYSEDLQLPTANAYIVELEAQPVSSSPLSTSPEYESSSATLEAIQVEAQALRAEQSQTRAVHVLSEALLQQTRGSDLARTVSSVNGVTAIKSGGVAKPVLRGQNGNRVLILQQGIKLQTQKWGLDHAPELDPFAYDSITVVQGAASVAYGPDAIGGVLILDVPTAPDEPGIEGDIDLVGATNNSQLGGAASVRTRLPGRARRWTLRTQGSFTKAANWVTPDYNLDNTGYEVLGISAGVGYDGPKTKAELSYSRYDGLFGLFTGVQVSNLEAFQAAVNNRRPFLVDTYEYSYEIERPFQDVSHDTVIAKLTHSLSNTSTITAMYAYQADARQELDRVRRARLDDVQIGLDLLGHIGSLKLDTYLGKGFELTAGAEMEYVFNDFYGSARLVADYEYWRGAGYSILRLVEPGYELELGFRVDVADLSTSQSSRINTAPRIENEALFVAPTATMGLIVPIGTQWLLRSQLATASRNPAVNELSIDGGSPGLAGIEVGLLGLELETAFDASLQLTGSGAAWGIDITLYGNYISDYIYFSPALDDAGQPRISATLVGFFPVYDYRNVDAGLIGANVQLLWRPLPFLEWRGRAALIRAQNFTDDTALQLIPADRFENRLSLRPLSNRDSLQIFIEHVYTRTQDNFDIGLDFAPPPDGYQLLGAGISGELDVWDRTFRISADVSNIFNESYRDYLSRLRYFADEPGRNFTFRVSMPFGAKFGENHVHN